MNVAFLGLGAIGEPMAAHLAGGDFDLTVWNRTHEKAERFVASHGGRAASSARDAVASADIVVLCLPSSVEVAALVEGDEGIGAALKSNSLMVDCTSGDPATSRRLGAELSARNIGFVDAPVSGGVKGAIAGTLTVMCGGSVMDVERAAPVLRAFGGKVIRCGDVGAGDAVKAMNQALLAIHIWSTGEALAALTCLNVDAAVALDVINGSSGRSNTSENLFPERLIGRAFPRTFKLALLDKDVRIAAGIVDESGIESPFIELAAGLFAEAHAELGDEADHVEAVRVIENRAGLIIG